MKYGERMLVCIERQRSDTNGKGSPRALEELTPTPAVNLRVDIDCLDQDLEGKGCLFVGTDEKQPKQFPVDASGRGDDRRLTQTLSRKNVLQYF